MKIIDKDYKLIPLDEIDPEAREIAKRWYDGVSELNDIREKHKLASDIMNYSRRQLQLKIDKSGFFGSELFTDQEVEEIIFKKFHGHTPEQWKELAKQYPYIELPSLVRLAAYCYLRKINGRQWI